ncbi:energy transducer TonB [Steroidobacter denitrificans]|nr:energy transducer TonB [Steroidobacter denitrificans]
MRRPFTTALVAGGDVVLEPAGAGVPMGRLELPAFDTRPEQDGAFRVPSARLQHVHRGIRDAWDRLGSRAVPLSIVLCMHALCAAVLLTSSIHTKNTPPTAPIQARMILESRPVQPVLPPPAVTLPEQTIDVQPPSPILVEHTPVPSKAISVPVIVPNNVPSAAPLAASPAPVTLPRFDADYLSNPTPAYPAVSRRLREEGTVVLRVLVRKNGEAAQVFIGQSSGFARLDRSARDTVTHWRFVPARDADGPVDEWVLVPIEFSLRR